MPSADGVVAEFPHTILEKINGTPSRIDINDAQESRHKMLHHDLPQGEVEHTGILL